VVGLFIHDREFDASLKEQIMPGKTKQKDSTKKTPDNTPKVRRKEYTCPHCRKKMNKWQVPPFNFSDGLGWCTDHLYICFNDECSFFTGSWGHMEEHYGQDMGYRCMIHPDSNEVGAIPAGSVDAMKGNILDEIQEAKDAESIARRNANMARLTEAFMAQSVEGIIAILEEEDEWPSVRLKAAQMLGDLEDLRALEPLMNISPSHEPVKKAIEDSVKKIHRANFTRECPHCAEIIKQRAKLCKHCGKEL